jgi:hypothetical protein
MQVQSSFSPIALTRRPANFNSAPAASTGDSVTLSTDQSSSFGNAMAWGGLSAVPIVGLAALKTSATNLHWTGSESAEKVAVAGAAANVAGTVALLGGAIFGSSASMATGLGLLVASAGAGAYSYSHMK